MNGYDIVDGTRNALARSLRFLVPANQDEAQATKNALRDAVMGRVDAARGMFGAAQELATNRNALAAALARQPAPFTDESAAKYQGAAEGFWNPAGLLGTVIKSKGVDAAKAAAASYKIPSPLYHGGAEPFNVYDGSLLGSATGAKDARIGAHLAGSFGNADFYAISAAEKAKKVGSLNPEFPEGWVGKFNLESSTPLVVSDDFLRKSLVKKLIRDKFFAADFAKRHGFDSIIYPHGTNVDAEFTAIALDPKKLKLIED